VLLNATVIVGIQEQKGCSSFVKDTLGWHPFLNSVIPLYKSVILSILLFDVL
jgi:hypothetical protein